MRAPRASSTKAQRAQLVPQLPVEHGVGVVGEGIDPQARVELRGPGPKLGRGPVAAFDLVGQQQRQEVRVGQRLGAGQRETFGQGVQTATEFHLV